MIVTGGYDLGFGRAGICAGLGTRIKGSSILFGDLVDTMVSNSEPSNFGGRFRACCTGGCNSVPGAGSRDGRITATVRGFCGGEGFGMGRRAASSTFVSSIGSGNCADATTGAYNVEAANGLVLTFCRGSLVGNHLRRRTRSEGSGLTGEIVGHVLKTMTGGVLRTEGMRTAGRRVTGIHGRLVGAGDGSFIGLRGRISGCAPRLEGRFTALGSVLSSGIGCFARIVRASSELNRVHFGGSSSLDRRRTS